MNYINELVKNIIISVILFSIVDVLIISKGIKKYIRLFCGFLLILIIFSSGKKHISEIINIKDIVKDEELMKTFYIVENKVEKISNELNQNEEKYLDEEKKKEIIGKLCEYYNIVEDCIEIRIIK